MLSTYNVRGGKHCIRSIAHIDITIGINQEGRISYLVSQHRKPSSKLREDT